MREFSTPALVEIEASATLTDVVADRAATAPGTVMLRRQRPDGSWVDVTAEDFHAQVSALAKGLIGAGVGPGDRVGLMARTRYEWTLADYEIWTAGAVTVPIYETSAPTQVAWILGDSGCTGVLVESGEHASTVGLVRDELPDLRHVWVIEHGALDGLTAAGAGGRAGGPPAMPAGPPARTDARSRGNSAALRPAHKTPRRRYRTARRPAVR